MSKVAFITGSVLNVLIGLAGLGVSYYIYTHPFMEVDKEVTKNEAIKQCSVLLRNNGFTVDPNTKKGTIEVSLQDLNNWQISMAKISSAIQSCEAMEMTKFCMGECASSKESSFSGIVSELKYIEPSTSK